MDIKFVPDKSLNTVCRVHVMILFPDFRPKSEYSEIDEDERK